MIVHYETPTTQPGISGKSNQFTARIERLLEQFDPISLAELERVSLLNRTDTKYVMRASQLHQALARLTDQYVVLETANTRLNQYQTLYFDTPDFELYKQHHNGLRSRYKVRMREYVDSDLAFWEVKRKTNQQRTVKFRHQTHDHTPNVHDKRFDAFVDGHTPFDAEELEPKLWNKFQRITLVSRYRPERLTLDVNLEFGWGDAYVALPQIAIAEVKQNRSSQHSDFRQQMRQLRVQPASFSKYCAGVYMIYDNVKINNFKPRMRLVEKLTQEELSHEYVR